MNVASFDIVFVGGGLQSALAALALSTFAPSARFAIVERSSRAGGNHTWCFHAGDLGPLLSRVVEPLVVRKWPAYDVAFPGLERTVADAYACVTSARLAEVMEEQLAGRDNARVLTGRTAIDVAAHEVVLDGDGERLEAAVVVDARGPSHFRSSEAVGYQKFVGLELTLASPAPFVRPLLIDARAPQTDGFRFHYVLPLAPYRVLVEETFFSDGPALDLPALRQSILAYARMARLDVAGVVREESGVLPLPLHVDPPRADLPLVAGYQGGWFHPTTGYSFPAAARLATILATTRPPDLAAALALPIREHARQQRFACLLNRMLFHACDPERRVDVLERFYRLPPETIRRFYAMETTIGDRARIVCGRPPPGVSVRHAVSRAVLG